MPQFTPAKAALAVAALLLAGLAIAYAAGLGGDDPTPVDDVSPTVSTTTPAATDAPTEAAPSAPVTSPATVAPTPTPTPTEPTAAAPAPSSYSPRPTPTTTAITTDMGPGAHDGDGE